MKIYKILRANEWQIFRDETETAGAPVDEADGFIHFSTASQVKETARKHFQGEDDLVLIAFDSIRLGEKLIWEPSRGGALFPHLYRRLSLDEILWSQELLLGENGHAFPEDLI